MDFELYLISKTNKLNKKWKKLLCIVYTRHVLQMQAEIEIREKNLFYIISNPSVYPNRILVDLSRPEPPAAKITMCLFGSRLGTSALRTRLELISSCQDLQIGLLGEYGGAGCVLRWQPSFLRSSPVFRIGSPVQTRRDDEQSSIDIHIGPECELHIAILGSGEIGGIRQSCLEKCSGIIRRRIKKNTYS